MAMSTTTWYDRAFVTVQGLNGVAYPLQAKTTSLSISGGGFDIEGIETFGGKVTRVGTRDDIELSFDGIPASHADFDWMWAGQLTSTAFGASGASISSSTTTKYRISVLWTNQTGITTATAAITGSNEAYRRAFCEAYLTSLEPSMDAGDHLKATFKFKLAESDENGVANWLIQAKDTTSGTLSAMNSYTSSSTKW